MPNFAQSLKAEIIRISRKEVKSSVGPVHAANVALKKSVAELRKQVAALESALKKSGSLQRKSADAQAASPAETAENIRITAKSIRALRAKLGLSQAAFAKLLGLSSQNILVMEHKEGRLRMRAKTLANVLAIRTMGRKEAQARLEALEGKAE